MDTYELLSQEYPGWSLTELRSLTLRERINWIKKASTRARR
jgi:hypothetical protein